MADETRKLAEEPNEARAGLVSGVAAGILIIALTAMGFVAFQPQSASPMRAATYEASSVISVD